MDFEVFQVCGSFLRYKIILTLCQPCHKVHQLSLSINPLQPGVAYLYPPKTSENLMFSGGIDNQHQAVMG